MDVLQFTLKNYTPTFSAYNNYYYCHDTGHSFEPIFMKFTWLMRVHTWVNPIFFFFFGNIWSNRTTDMGKMCPKTDFLAFIQLVWGYRGKKFQSRIWYLISHRKRYIHFFRWTPHSLKKLPPIYISVILRNIVFFKNCYMKNI